MDQTDTAPAVGAPSDDSVNGDIHQDTMPGVDAASDAFVDIIRTKTLRLEPLPQAMTLSRAIHTKTLRRKPVLQAKTLSRAINTITLHP